MFKSLNRYNYDTDKPQYYIEIYEELFSHLADKSIKLLEIGIDKGGSILMWNDFFEKGIIAGIDIREIKLNQSPRIHLFQGRAEDTDFLDRVSKEVAPEGFNIIIDDASHIAEYTRKSFWFLFDNYLKKDGIFIIEDWGTGYWEGWPDGKRYDGQNHLAGMVGFIKELVDETNRADITGYTIISKFKEMRIISGFVMVVKR